MTYKIQAGGQAGRVGYLDLAKGIAILSMVLCHVVTVPFTVLAWVFSFHMPIFFIISGILLSRKKTFDRQSFRRNFIRKLETIICPYLIFSLIYSCLAIVWDILSGNMAADPVRIIKSVIYYIAFGYHALWFLPAAFIANILFHALHSISKKQVRLVIDGILLLVTSIVARYISGRELTKAVYIIIFFNRALIGCLFVELGYYLARVIDAVKKDWLKPVIAVICLGIYAYTSLLNVPDLHFCRIENPLLYYFNAAAGSLGILLLCGWIDTIADIKLLKYYGRNSLTVLLTHILFVVFLKHPALLLTVKYLGDTRWFELYYFAALCIAQIPIIEIYNRIGSNTRRHPA